MKCGREIALGQVFCKECLADMAQYPIAPGTPVPVFSPLPTAQPKRATPARKQKKPEEQILHLKKVIKGLSIALAVVILVFSLITGFLLRQLNEDRDTFQPGQNYSTVDNSG